MVLGWIITRALIFGILALRSYIVGDVFYYHRKIAALFDVGLASTLNEYPTPVVWILTLPYAITGGNEVGYLIAFMVFMLVLDGAFTYALWRSGGRRHDAAINFWLIFVLLIGPLSYVRFDLIPAVLAGGAVLAARRRPTVAGILTGVGAAVKLWPALLIVAIAAHRPARKPALIGFVIAGFGLAAVSLAAGGLTRLFSPLTWQSGRGLQVESVWATPLMIARALDPDAWQVGMSRFQAYEIFGSGVDGFLVLSDIATLLGLVTLIVLFVRAYRSTPDAIAVATLVLAVVAVMIVTNKTLSPQYLLWLGGPLAAMLVLAREATGPERRMVRRLTPQVLVLAGLTQLVYPLLYDGLLGGWGSSGLLLSTGVTALRNVALVIFTVEVCRYAWRLTSSSPATPTPAAGARR